MRVLMIPKMFIVQVLALVGMAVGSQAAQVGVVVTPGLEEGFLKFGALGLCALMVYQNYKSSIRAMTAAERQRKELLSVITQQQADLKAKNDQVEALHVETLAAIRKCAGPGGGAPR